MLDLNDRRIAAWLGLALFGIYLLSFSGMMYSQDSLSMFSVTESFVKRGEFNTDQLWTLFKARNEIAPDGESYAKYGYGMSLLAAPLYALAFYLPFDLGLMQTTLLTSSIIIALAGALVFLSARRLRVARDASLGAAILFGLATPAFVYAKQFWSEPYALFALSATFYFLQCYRAEKHWRDALIAGFALGLLIATRVTNAALIPIFAGYGFASTLRDQDTRRGLVGFACALGVVLLSIAWYDWVRYGNPLATGYRADETFNTPLLVGMYGLLFSPGKGLFVYIPFLAALPFSLPIVFKRAKTETILFGIVIAFYVLLFSLWYYWWGGTNWGPRFLVPTIPFLILLTLPAIELALARTRKWFSFVFAILCGASFIIELIGITIPSLAYRTRMTRLSANPDMDAIFVPQFSPLVGYFNLLRPSAMDFAWLRVIDGNLQIDWVLIGLTVVFIAVCIAMLYRTTHSAHHATPAMYNAIAVVVAIALSLISLSRYRTDPHFAGGGYQALIETMAREEQPGDVLILNDDARVLPFFNTNRARMRWYGLSRDPKQFDEATRALLTRLSQQYTRVWFAYDDAASDTPDPARVWLAHSLESIGASTFDDSVHLVIYQTHRQR